MKLLTSATKIMLWLALPLAIGASTLLFAPGDFLAKLGLESLRETHRPVLGWLFIGAGSCGAGSVLWMIMLGIGRLFVYHRHQRRKRKAMLRDLTPEQRGYLLEFVQGARTMEYLLMDGVAGTLRQRDIIYISVRKIGMISAPHRIRGWARRELKRRPGLLEGAIKLQDRTGKRRNSDDNENKTIPLKSNTA